MSSNDSSQIRRQIGFFQKQLKNTNHQSQLHLRSTEIEQHDFRHLDNDELESFRNEIVPLRRSFLKAYQKITKLHDEWVTLQDSKEGEQAIFDDYISKYGDYRESITTSVNRLESLDRLLNAIDQEYFKRNLNVPSDISKATSLDEYGNEPASTKGPTLHRGSQPPPSRHPPAPQFSTDSSLLNFVDASIITKMELPTFDGNLLDYPEFASRFATLVGNKTQLDNTTKLSLLKSCLRGRALQSIQGLSMMPENYAIAMDILRTHYDDKVTMKHILYTKLAQLPDCDPKGRQLQTLYNRMFALIRQFSDNKDDSNKTALGAILLNKLPARVKSRIYDMTSNSHNLSPSELLRLLTEIVRKDAILSEMNYHSRPQQPQQDQYGSFHITMKPKSQRQLTSPRSRPRIKPCPYCNNSYHSPISCDLYSTPHQRSLRVKELRHCFNCLSNQHPTRDCRSSSKRHRSSLCFSRGQPSRQNIISTRGTTHNSYSKRSQPHQQSVHVVETTQNGTRDLNHKSPETATAACSFAVPPKSKHERSPQTTLRCTPVLLFNPSRPSLETTMTVLTPVPANHILQKIWPNFSCFLSYQLKTYPCQPLGPPLLFNLPQVTMLLASLWKTEKSIIF
uniref:Integrase catalytic domain-containing protein n=1 Tax=Haemonchus placei TaxID=6290 RepID=A0A0N4WA57_HAEPC